MKRVTTKRTTRILVIKRMQAPAIVTVSHPHVATLVSATLVLASQRLMVVALRQLARTAPTLVIPSTTPTLASALLVRCLIATSPVIATGATASALVRLVAASPVIASLHQSSSPRVRLVAATLASLRLTSSALASLVAATLVIASLRLIDNVHV